MLPGKIFFQGVRYEGETNLANSNNYRLNLVLNDLYYDELKQFHTKYICVTATDTLTFELHQVEAQQLLGTTTLSEVYKLLYDQKTVEVKVKTKEFFEVTLLISFELVQSLSRKKHVSPSKKIVIVEELSRSPNKEAVTHFEMAYRKDTKAQTGFAASINPDTVRVNEVKEGDSLQSLAQQREKILGELFGKFKRQR